VQALRLDAKLFGWIMDDEWVSREEIHSIARRHSLFDKQCHSTEAQRVGPWNETL